jgi:hypothetical protein
MVLTKGMQGMEVRLLKLVLLGPIAVDNVGNLFIADMDNNIIRKVDATGIITTYAGILGAYGYSGDGGPATAAKLYHPD